MTTLIKNGTVVTATDIYNADILIKSGLITEIGKDIAKITEEVIDATDKYVFPGGVDVHTHLDISSGDIASPDDFESGTVAATYGGTTTIVNYAEQLKGNTLQESFETWARKAEGKAVIDYGFHLVIREYVDSMHDEISSLVKNGVTSFKCSMGNRENGSVRDSNLFLLLQKLKECGGLLCIHGENEEIVNVLTRKMLVERKIEPKYHAVSRPPELEGEGTGRAITLAELLRAPVYIVSLSAAHALEKVKAARDRGNPIYAETCPQYLLLSSDSYEADEFNGAKYVCTPPLRPKWHQEILWRGLSSGDLQVVASDHCSFNFRGQKDVGRGDFSKIPSGLPAIEHRLQLLYTGGVLTGKIGLNKFVDLLATSPAKLFGLFPKKGTIAIGSDADLVVFDPNIQQKISAETHHMRVDYNPFEGFNARGSTLAVMSKGVTIVKNGKFVGKPGAGELVRRKPFVIQ